MSSNYLLQLLQGSGQTPSPESGSPSLQSVQDAQPPAAPAYSNMADLQSQQPAPQRVTQPPPSGLKSMLMGYMHQLGQSFMGQPGPVGQSQIAHNNAQTNYTKAQTDQLGDTVMLDIPGVGQMPVSKKDVGATLRSIMSGEYKVKTTNSTNDAKKSVAQIQVEGRKALDLARQQGPLAVAQTHLANAKAELAEAANDPDSPVFKSAMQKAQWANYYKDQALKLSQQRADFQMNGPTGNIRTQGQMADALLGHMDELKKKIADLGAQGKLGPIAGRYSEFMAGKVGDGDPEYSSLRTSLGLFQTALMKAHIGARGSEKIMEHFKNLFDGGKFTPESLDAALDSAAGYLKSYKDAGTYKPGGQPAPSSGGFWGNIKGAVPKK